MDIRVMIANTLSRKCKPEHGGIHLDQNYPKSTMIIARFSKSIQIIIIALFLEKRSAKFT